MKEKYSHYIFSTNINLVYHRPPSNSPPFSIQKKTHRKLRSTGPYYIYYGMRSLFETRFVDKLEDAERVVHLQGVSKGIDTFKSFIIKKLDNL